MTEQPWETLFNSLNLASTPLLNPPPLPSQLSQDDYSDLSNQSQAEFFSQVTNTSSSNSSNLASGLTQLQLATSATQAAAAAESYTTLHQQTLQRLSLPPSTITSAHKWSIDLLQVISRITPTGRRSRWLSTLMTILSGRLNILNSYNHVVDTLRTTVGGIRKEDEDVDLAELLFAVLVVLDLRWIEAEFEGRLLDSIGRNLRWTLRGMLEGKLTPSLEESEEGEPEPPSSMLSITSSPPKPGKLLRPEDIVSESDQTLEQKLILNSPTTPGFTLIKAFAGTGKTTSLVLFTANLVFRNPRIQILYCCFNQKLYQDAEWKLRFWNSNASAKTTGRLAYHYLIQRRGASFERKFAEGRQFKITKVVQLLGLRDGSFEVPGKGNGARGRLNAKAIATRIMRSLSIFCGSSSKEVTMSHIVKQKPSSPNIPQYDLYNWTQELWGLISDWDNLSAPAPFECHVKLCLMDKDFKLDDKYEVILYDEVQDSSDADLEFIVRQADHARVVLVGDEHQAVYRWRGGLNTWLKLQKKADTVLRLSQSFRFGSQIANVANLVLTAKGESEPLRGNKKDGMIFRPLKIGELVPDDGRCWTLLFRTNKGLVEALFSLSLNLVSSRSNLRNPLKISLKVANKSAFTNNSTEDPSPCGSLLSIYYHAYDLYHKTPSPTLSQLLVKTSGYPHKHQLLAEYSSWEEVKDVVREFGDDLEDEERQLSEVVAMEDELRERSFKEKLDRASGCVVGEDEDPDIILGVTHQVKGLEWENVALGDDYIDCFEQRSSSVTGFLAEEFNLLYVALTRAKERLVLPRPLFRLALLQRGLHSFSIDHTSSSACMMCFSQSSPFIHYSTPFPAASSSSTNQYSSSSSNSDPTTPDFSSTLHTTPQKRARSTSPDADATPKPPKHKPPETERSPPEETELDTSFFPCCLGCASKATFIPLREFAELWIGIGGVMKDDGSGRIDLIKTKGWIKGLKEKRDLGNIESVDFVGFEGTVKERAEKIGGQVFREIRVADMWAQVKVEGDDMEASPSPSKRMRLD